MTYQYIWWHSPVEYGAGLNPGHTWPSDYEQYRRPSDQRQYNIPIEPIESKLYYEHPTMGMPKYRGTFRDKPQCVTSYYPSGVARKPDGFHGRLYYEQCGPTKFAYNGPPKDDLHFLERPPCNPSFPRTKPTVVGKEYRVFEGMNLPQCPKQSTLELTYGMRQSPVVTGSQDPNRMTNATSVDKYKTNMAA